MTRDLNDLMKQFKQPDKLGTNQAKEGSEPILDPVQVYQQIRDENRRQIETMTGYSCDICWGSGQAYIDGRFQYCPSKKCDAVINLRRLNLLKVLNQFGDIPDIYASFTFDTWIKSVNPAIRKGKELALYTLEYLVNHNGIDFSLYDVLTHDLVLKRIDDKISYDVKIVEPDLNSSNKDDHYQKLNLYFDGVNRQTYYDSFGHSVVLASETKGMGKTGLCVAAAKFLIDRGVAVAFVHLPSLLRDSRQATRVSMSNDTGSSDTATYDDLMLPIQRADVLFIDDFNVPYDPSRHDMRIIEDEIIQRRWSDNKPVIITTNHSQSSFTDQWGERASSRVFEMCHWVELKGRVARRQNRPNS